MKRRDLLKALSISILVPKAGAAVSPDVQATPGSTPADPVRVLKTSRAIADNVTELYLSFLETHAWDPQDDLLRTELRTQMEALLAPYKQRRDIHDALVVCDARNNPMSVIDTGLIGLMVMWKPVRLSSYMVLTFAPKLRTTPGGAYASSNP